MDVIVNSVNDLPVIGNIPDLTIAQGASNSSTDLDNYITDVETTDANIIWSYTGNNKINVEINNSTHVTTFTAPNDWYGTENITFTAKDADNASVSDNVKITVPESVNSPPVVGDIPNVSFDEDSGPKTGVDLDAYVTDDKTTDANIVWSYTGNDKISVNIDQSSHVVTYDSPANWFGSENIVFTAKDEGNLTDSDNIGAVVNSVNDAPVNTQNIDDKITQKNQPINIYLPSHFSDVDNTINEMMVEVLNLQNATYQVLEENLWLIPNSGFSGNINDLIVKLTDPGSLSAQSNAFELEVLGVPMSLVTFTFKSVYEDAVLNSGESTLIWNKLYEPWAVDSVRTSNNGIVQVQMEQGVPYQVNGLHENSIDFGGLISYTFFRGDAHEQRAVDDESSPLTFNTENPNVTIYKPMSDFPIFWISEYASKLGGVNIGIRRFGDNDLNATAFWSLNYNSPTTNERTWLDEIVADLATIPHVGLTFQYQEGTTPPTTPYLAIAVDNSFPLGDNGTSFNSQTHEIINSSVLYRTGPNEYTFKIEIWQAIGDLNDYSTQDPQILDAGNNHNLNITGRKIFSLMYLADPKTKF